MQRECTPDRALVAERCGSRVAEASSDAGRILVARGIDRSSDDGLKALSIEFLREEASIDIHRLNVVKKSFLRCTEICWVTLPTLSLFRVHQNGCTSLI